MSLDSGWIDDYRRTLNHKIRMDAIREEGARNLKKIQEDAASLRRNEEAASAACTRCDYALARAVHRGQVPLGVAQHYFDLLHDQQGIVIPEDQPHLGLWRADIEADARRMNVTIWWAPECAGINAYAWVKLKRIEIAPATSAGLYATAKHELGHVARPCARGHQPIMTAGKKRCVACELEAWRWAIVHSQPTWSRRMHDRLTRSLLTYRSFGTAAEQTKIDDLVSDLGFYRAWHERVSSESRQ